MGWSSSGTSIFDSVIGSFIKDEKIPDKSKLKIIKTLINALECHDWDGQCESCYYHKLGLVRDVFQKRNPEWFRDVDNE